MQKINYFFRRREFSTTEISKSYYEYLGYSLNQERNSQEKPSSQATVRYPILLYFGRDELAFYFHNHNDGRIKKIFSLYVADGELNQQNLSKKVENYWKMPLWSPPFKGFGSELWFHIDSHLTSMSFFSNLYDFDIKAGNQSGFSFVRRKLFRKIFGDKVSRKKENSAVDLSDKTITFHYSTSDTKREDADVWQIDNNDISSRFINFRKLLLDFFYELDYTTTFEDENFYKLQPILQNNKLLDALSRKCLYLDELSRIQSYKFTERPQELPQSFLKAENAWLHVCFQENALQAFISADSVFDIVEEEVKTVLFRASIGKAKRRRIKCFTREDRKVRERVARQRNQAATFFLRRYSLGGAIKALMPQWIFALGIFFIILTGFGDFLCAQLKDEKIISDLIILPPAGTFSYLFPVIGLFGLIFNFWFTNINLFKLIMPRLFLGIMMGWAVFWNTEESWKAAVISHWKETLVVNLILFVIIGIYIFTDIRNKLIKTSNKEVIKRAICLLVFAMLISLVQGFYVLQFRAESMLENSGFLELSSKNLVGELTYDEEKELYGKENQLVFLQELDSIKNKDQKRKYLNNFKMVSSINNSHLYYIWSIHLSQFMMAILIGVILQLLWEDRPITEPL